MIIPINLPSSPSADGRRFPPQLAKLGTEEVVLLELQGAFHVEGDQRGQMAARLQMENEVYILQAKAEGRVNEDILWQNSKPTLQVGHHLLEGKIVNLPKPLAVLYKKTPSKGPASDSTSNSES